MTNKLLIYIRSLRGGSLELTWQSILQVFKAGLPRSQTLARNDGKSNSSFICNILLICLLNTPTTFANFGATCTPLTPAPSDTYLQVNTLYGYLINNIDVTSYVTDPCDTSNENINFCFKQIASGASGCVATITMALGDSKTLGDLNSDPYLGGNALIKNTVLTVARVNNSICLTIPTSRGPLAIACKMTTVAPPAPNPNPIPICKPIGESCYSGNSKSQSLFNFTGVAVNCLSETLNKIFYTSSNCTPDPNEPIEMSIITPFPIFQQHLTNAIRTALALYILFFGIKIALNPGSSDLNSAASFVIKALLVMYFSVGIGPMFYQDGKPTIQTGMLDYVLPTLADATPEFAQIVFNSGGARGLCEFDTSKYPQGYGFYALWDAIDCRIGYYLGVSLLYDTSSILQGVPSTPYDPPGSSNTQVQLGAPGSDGIDTLNSPVVPRFFAVMFGFLMAGNIIVVAAGLAFAIVFMSVILHFLSSYLVCLITLYTMTYISPIFIPMALFTRTKSYYDAWLKVTVSCVFQPAVLAGFVALLLNMYDTAIFKNCEFRRHDYTTTNANFSTFEIRLPNSSPEDCQNSAGYKLLQYYIGQGWEHIGLILIKIHYINDIYSLMVDLLYVIVFTIIFYYFSQSMSQFAADITNGPMMNAVTTSPTKVVDAIKAAGSYAMQAAQSYAGGGAPPMPPGGGSTGRSGGPSADTASAGGGGSSDTASKGGGGGSSDTSSTGGK
jgi:type IV secretion system protein VirB6